MIKFLFGPIITLFTSGVLFHRSSFIGILCGIWIYFGTDKQASTFSRILTPDLYLLMLSFLFLYRLCLKRIYTADGELDLKEMSVYLAGDFARAVLAMVCSALFFLSFGVSGDRPDEAGVFQQQIDKETKNLPPHVQNQINREIKKYVPF